MICPYCGEKNSSDSLICEVCRRSLTSDFEDTHSDEKPILVIKPTFIPEFHLKRLLLFTLIFAPLSTALIGFITLILYWVFVLVYSKINILFRFSIIEQTIIAFYVIIFFILIPYIIYLNTKRSILNTKYRFYSDRIEHDSGYRNFRQRTLKISNFTEIQLIIKPRQKEYNLGTLILIGSSVNAGMIVSPSKIVKPNKLVTHIALMMDNIENPKKHYRILQGLLNENFQKIGV